MCKFLSVWAIEVLNKERYIGLRGECGLQMMAGFGFARCSDSVTVLPELSGSTFTANERRLI